jgi:hypothetical protein
VRASRDIETVSIGARAVSIGRPPVSMQTVTGRNEIRDRSRGSGDGSSGRVDGSFEPSPASVQTRARSLESFARWIETVTGRTANRTFSEEGHYSSSGAVPISFRRSPFSNRPGDGSFGPSPSSVPPRHRPKETAPPPKDKEDEWIEGGQDSLETGAISIRRAKVSIERGEISIEPCRLSIERRRVSKDRSHFSSGYGARP